MNTLTLVLILLTISINSFGDISPNLDSGQSERREIFKQENLSKKQFAEISKSLNQINSRYQFPVVDHHSSKMKIGLEHIKKCIKEETEGTIDTYDNKLLMTFSVLPSGLVNNIQFENIEELPIYLKACFISGISRVVFPQPLDGENTIISQQFALKLNTDAPIKDQRLNLNLIGRSNVLPRLKL